MIYIITCKRPLERHDNVELENTTEVNQKIKWKGNEYRVKEIIIVNPDDGIIELKCTKVNKDNSPPIYSVNR